MRDIHITVRTSMKREFIEERKDGRLLIAVSAPRKEGKANARICEIIAERFAVPVERVRIIRGKDQPAKILRIHDDDVPPTSRKKQAKKV